MGPKKKVSQRRSEALDSVADLAAITNEDGDDGGDEGGGDGDVRDVQFTAVLVAAASSQGIGPPPLSLGGTDFENGGRK